MFSGATSANPDTSGWNTAKVTDMGFMFSGATSANPDVSGWDITNVDDMDGMFGGVTLSTADYDAILTHFNSQLVISNIPFSGGNSKYCAVAAHDNLTNAATGHGWVITDEGLDTNCNGVIFENSFEDVLVFKAAEKQFVYDFAEVSLNLDPNPLLIAKGVDAQNNTVIKIYLRQDVGQLQIRMDTIELNESNLNQWNTGEWQNSDNKNLSMIQWQ
jgi:surface protein